MNENELTSLTIENEDFLFTGEDHLEKAEKFVSDYLRRLIQSEGEEVPDGFSWWELFDHYKDTINEELFVTMGSPELNPTWE